MNFVVKLRAQDIPETTLEQAAHFRPDNLIVFTTVKIWIAPMY